VNVLIGSMSDPGYLYPAIAVARELRRGNDTVHVIGRPSAAPAAAAAGLPFLAAKDYGGSGGFSVSRWFLGGLAQYRAILRAAAEVRADVLVTSVLCHGALLAAELLDIPVVVLGLAAHLWDYPAGGADEPQPPSSHRHWRTSTVLEWYGGLREQVSLPARTDTWPSSPLFGTALLLRGDAALEHPGAVLPERVHHVGPFEWEPAPDPAELDRVTETLYRVGKPVVYVHLGRVFGGTGLWPRLNATFSSGPFQAVVEQGRSSDPLPAAGADILLVREPWMGPLIDRSGVVWSSSTSAPVLAALLRGRPLVVSPAGSEQPVLAAACVRAGVAVRVPDEAGPDLSAVLRSAWRDDGLRERAQALGRRLAGSPGARRAADIIRAAAGGRQPRLNVM
jgi:UDP:flavonoid glycosyltransferase YjiC (YdhE family)